MNKNTWIVLISLWGLCGAMVLAVVIAAAGVALGWFSLFGVEHPKRELARLEAQYGEDVRTWQASRDEELKRYHEQLAAAKAALPADAPIARDWDWREAVQQGRSEYDCELLRILLSAYRQHPELMLDPECDSMREKFESLATYSERLTDLERLFFEVKDDSCALRERLEQYLLADPRPQELAYALRHDVIDLRYWDTAATPYSGDCSHELTAIAEMIALATATGLNGDTDKAFDIIIHAYDLERRTRATSFEALRTSIVITHTADAALQQLLPVIEWTPERTAQIESRLHTSKEDVAALLRTVMVGPYQGIFDEFAARDYQVDRSTLLGYAAADALASTYADSPEAFATHLQLIDEQINEDVDFSLLDLVLRGTSDWAVQWRVRDVRDLAISLSEFPLRPRVFAAARQLEAYRSEHGAYPATLEELPNAPVDLTSCRMGKPVTYVRDGDQYRLETSVDGDMVVLWRSPSRPACGQPILTENPG